MNANRIAIVISILVMAVSGLTAGLAHSHGAVFNACLLLLSCSFATFYYSVLQRVYQW
ncbi:MAG: hypothetical protein IKD93_01415 [Firmicutes bacterium]|nr:hypothetical protein [Bacillota bacterium]